MTAMRPISPIRKSKGLWKHVLTGFESSLEGLLMISLSLFSLPVELLMDGKDPGDAPGTVSVSDEVPAEAAFVIIAMIKSPAGVN